MKNSIQVLHVDDEVSFLELLKIRLESISKEIRVKSVVSPEKALSLIEKQHFDVIISDYQMTPFDGLEFLDRLRKGRNSIPFIILTGKGREEVVVEALNMGADFYLEKIPDISTLATELMHYIKQAVEKSRIEMEMKNVFEHTGTAMCIVEKNGVIVKCNHQFERLSGFNAKEIQNKKKWMEFIPPDDINQIDIIIVQVSEVSHIEHKVELEFYNKKRELHYVLATTRHIPHSTRSVLSFLDITEMKQTEKSLQQSNERYRQLIDLSPDSIASMDLEGNFLTVNPQSVVMYRAKDEKELLSKNAFDFCPPEEREKAEFNLKRALKFGKVQNLEYTNLRMDGSRFPIDINCSVIKNDEGEPVALIAITRDITERKEAEKRFKETMELEKEYYSEEQLFLDILTHDLKNLFFIILGSLELITIKEIDENLEMYLQNIFASAVKARSLIENISVIMKHRTSTTQELQPINLEEAFTRIKKMLFPIFPMKEIEIIEDVEIDLQILADPLFDQLVMNILTNAVKNDSAHKVIIEVSAKRTSDNFVVITFTDYGKGIPPEKRNELFERFNKNKEEGKGYGLGMHIVKTLVKRYKGSIKIESRLSNDYQKGTSIVLQFPDTKDPWISDRCETM